jgi:hypothetical protein
MRATGISKKCVNTRVSNDQKEIFILKKVKIGKKKRKK